MSASSKKKLRKEQNAAQLTEKQLKEQKEAKKLRTQTLAFTIAIALVFAIALGTLAVTIYKNSGISERGTTALTVGKHNLTAAQLNYFFMDNINGTYRDWYEQYGDYTSAYLSMLYGFDLTKPLNEQTYDEESGKTYADYFAEQAVLDAVNAYTVYDAAVAAGHKLTEADIESIDAAMKTLADNTASSNYANVADYLKAFYGNGATEKTFREYLEVLGMVSSYELATYDALQYTQEQLDAYNTEHFNEFSSFDYCTFYMNGNDFLECTASESDTEHSHSDEEKEAGLKAAEAAANDLAGRNFTDADLFNKAIRSLTPYKDKDTSVCSEANDKLYTGIANSDIAEWLAEEGRKAGDKTVIVNATETTDDNGNTVSDPYGYTVVLFLGRSDNEMKMANVRHILISAEGDTDEAKNKAKEAVDLLYTNWKQGAADEEAFSALAMANSTDGGSAANGGLYENVYPGQMVPAFNDWCFDEARQPGDHGIVETEYGYHIMFFVGHSEETYRDYMLETSIRNEDYSAWYEELVKDAAHTVHDLSKLPLDMKMSGN